MLGSVILGSRPLGSGFISGSPPSNNEPTGDVWITGTSKVGKVLTINNDLADADGLGSFIYAWLMDDVVVDGATGLTYVPVSADVGAIPKGRISYTDGEGNEEEITSEAYDEVVAADELEDDAGFIKPIFSNIFKPILSNYDQED